MKHVSLWKVLTRKVHYAKSWLKQDYSEHDRLNQPQVLVSIVIRPNTFKIADGWQDEAIAQKNQNWGYYEGKCLVQIWADKEVQRQLLAMGKKQNIWENVTLPQNLMITVTSGINCWTCRKRNILHRRKRKCRLLVKRLHSTAGV